MYKLVNGKLVEMTEEEIREHAERIESDSRKAEIAERSRPLTVEEVNNLIIRQTVNTLEVDDNTALRMKDFYPEWAFGVSYAVGYKVQRNGKLWRVLQNHTSQNGWEPENAPSLWEQINEIHKGTMDDPIPYEGNMELIEGKYYVQDYMIYRCIRNTENPVHHVLTDLVGLYVEII